MKAFFKKIKLTWKITLFTLLALNSVNSFAESSQPESKESTSSAGAGKEYTPESREYHLKAAFLRYVAKYIEWPANSLQEGIINICVLGQIPYFEGINSINRKVVNDRALSIIKINSPEDAIIKHCQMVFVAKTEQEWLHKIITAFANQPILGFGDMDSYAQEGGQMNFYTVNNRLAIMTNIPAITDSYLKINPEMLRLVTIVPPIDQSKPFAD